MLPTWAGSASAAEQRGITLLLSCLTEEQRSRFYREAQFEVRGKSGMSYTLTFRGSGGILYKGRDGLLHSLCVVAATTCIPVADIVLAQLLMIRCEEREFWRLARFNPGMAA